MHILVIGANGYMGAAIAKALRANGHIVYGSIRREADAPELVRNEIIPIIGDSKAVSEKPLPAGVSIVIDTAPLPISEEAVAPHWLAVIERANSAESKLMQPIRYIFTTGGLQFGDQTGKLLSESHLPTPNILALTQRAYAEKVVLTAGHTVVRPSFTYGGSCGVGSNVSGWFNLESKTADIVVSGRPEKMWSWNHVSDVASAYVAVAEAPANVTRGEIYHIADHTRLTWIQVREKMARAAGSTGAVKSVPATSFFDQLIDIEVVSDSTKLRRTLGWTPKHQSFADDMPLYFAAWAAHQTGKSSSSSSSSSSDGHAKSK